MSPSINSPGRRWLAVLGLAGLVAAAGLFLDRHRADRSSAAGLSERDYQRLWDVEHVVFELNHNVFEQMKQALVEEDGQLALQALASHFQGAWPTSEPQ